MTEPATADIGLSDVMVEVLFRYPFVKGKPVYVQDILSVLSGGPKTRSDKTLITSEKLNEAFNDGILRKMIKKYFECSWSRGNERNPDGTTIHPRSLIMNYEKDDVLELLRVRYKNSSNSSLAPLSDDSLLQEEIKSMLLSDYLGYNPEYRSSSSAISSGKNSNNDGVNPLPVPTLTLQVAAQARSQANLPLDSGDVVQSTVPMDIQQQACLDSDHSAASAISALTSSTSSSSSTSACGRNVTH
mmetsp:Transcript_11701/g.19227  ORF Transcript_11701/g.19227 Transcript_11701/m.19227 type:complete len:244 (-) Transcript_11701:2023-2754(-)